MQWAFLTCQELELRMLFTRHMNHAGGILPCRGPPWTPVCAGVLHVFLHTSAPLHMKSCLLALRVVRCLSLWESSLLGATYESGQAQPVSFLSWLCRYCVVAIWFGFPLGFFALLMLRIKIHCLRLMNNCLESDSWPADQKATDTVGLRNLSRSCIPG